MKKKYIYAVYYRSRTDCFYSKHYFPTYSLARDFYEQFIDLGFYSFIKKIPLVKEQLNSAYGKMAQEKLKEEKNE